MRIFVFRPEADAQKSALALRARGLEPVMAPLFTIEASGETPPEGPFAALVLTSGNAVSPLTAAPPGWRDLPVFTVGASTAAKARLAGFRDTRSADGDRNDLIELITRTLPAPARLLLVAGKDRHDDVATRLIDGGYEVAVWTAYEAQALTALPDDAAKTLREGGADAALHYSPRGAQVFLTLAQQAGLTHQALDLTHVALSAEVAAPLIAAGAATIVVAEYPEEAALLAALEEVSGRNRVGADATQGDAASNAGATAGMAEESEPMSESDSQPARRGRARRQPPTIDLQAVATPPADATATEGASAADAPAETVLPTEALSQEFRGANSAGFGLLPEAAEPTPDAGPSTQAASPSPSPAPEPAAANDNRSRLPGMALAGIVGGIVGAGLVVFAMSRLTSDTSARQIAELTSRIEALASRSALDAVDRKASANAERLTELAAAPKAPDASALTTLSQQAQRAEAAATALGQRLEQNTARIGSVETLARTAAAPSPQALAAARIVLAERVQSAIASGQPFAADVAALAKGGGASEQLAALNAVATTGAATKDALQAQFREHRAMFAREIAPVATSWQDKVMALASRVVTIRPVGETGVDDPATLVLRLENALARGEIGASARLWQQLPEPARRQSAAFGAALQARAAAEAAIARIAQEAVAALGAAG